MEVGNEGNPDTEVSVIDVASLLAMVHEVLVARDPDADTWPVLVDAMEEGGLDVGQMRGCGFCLWLIPTGPRELDELLVGAVGNVDAALAHCRRCFPTRLELEAFTQGLLERKPDPWWLGHDVAEARALLERGIAQLLASQTVEEVFNNLLPEEAGDGDVMYTVPLHPLDGVNGKAKDHNG